jgi:hypothetical protein
MMEMIKQVADNKRGQRAIEWTKDNRQQHINNYLLIGVAMVGGDTAVKAKALQAGNEVFCH